MPVFIQVAHSTFSSEIKRQAIIIICAQKKGGYFELYFSPLALPPGRLTYYDLGQQVLFPLSMKDKHYFVLVHLS